MLPVIKIYRYEDRIIVANAIFGFFFGALVNSLVQSGTREQFKLKYIMKKIKNDKFE